MPRGVRVAQGKVIAAGLPSSEVKGNSRSRRFPVTVTHPLVTRGQICHRTVAGRPGNLSEVLTGHYRRAHPASVPGSRPRRPSAPSADATTSLPTRDELAAGLDRKTPAVTERGRSTVTADTKNRLRSVCIARRRTGLMRPARPG
jgi:hypothetical protein